MTFDWSHVATHKMGARELVIYRDDTRGVTWLRALNYDGFGSKDGQSYYYIDDAFVPRGPFHTERALAHELETGQQLELIGLLEGR